MATKKVPINTVKRVLAKLYEERHVSAETRSQVLHDLQFKSEGMEYDLEKLPDRVRTAVQSELAGQPAPASV